MAGTVVFIESVSGDGGDPGATVAKVVDGSTVTGWVSSASVAVNSDIFLTGSSSVSDKVSAATVTGYGLGAGLVGEPWDFSATGTDRENHIFMIANIGGTPDTLANGGFGIIVADDLATDSFGTWYVGPQAGSLAGWEYFVIDPEADFDAVTAGSGSWTLTGNPAQLSGVDGTGVRWKTLNTIMGASDNCFLQTMSVGVGYRITGTDAVFAEIATYEETNRFGAVQTKSGTIFPMCKIRIGTPSGAGNTTFIDDGFKVIWQGQTLSDGTTKATRVGFYGLFGDQGSGTTDITLSNGSLEAASPEEFDLNMNGVNSFTALTLTVDRARVVVLGSTTDWDGGIIKNSGLITMNGGTLNNVTISGGTMAADGSQLLWNTSADPNGELDGLTIISHPTTAHHAIEFDSNAPLSITLTDVFFTDFNASNGQNDSTLNFTDGSGKAYTVNINGGSTPSYKVAGTSTVTVVNAKPIVVSGLTQGTAVVIQADETVGTRTKGDTLFSGFADVNGEINTAIAYEAAFDPSGLDVIVRARNAGIAVAAIAEDNGTSFTDETEEASSNTTGDMTLLPATPAANDAYYFAHTEQFTRLKLDISTALAFSVQPTVTWEYWNGAWVSLTGVTDDTNGFETSGENIVSWSTPSGWATTTVNSQGPFYYVRARLSTAGTITTSPVGRKVTLDVTRYLPYTKERVFTDTGLTDVANWVVDTVGKFAP